MQFRNWLNGVKTALQLSRMSRIRKGNGKRRRNTPPTYNAPAELLECRQLLSGVNGVVVDDHGNSATDATVIGINETVNVNVEQSADQDWFRVEATAGTSYVFETTAGSLRDTTLTLYGDDGTTQLAFNDDGGAGLASRIEWTADRDQNVYLKGKAWSRFRTGTYDLAVSGTQVEQAEVGSSAATAVAVSVGQSVDGSISQRGAESWFVIEATAGQMYNFSTTLDTLRDSTLTLYGANGQQQLQFDDDGGAGRASSIEFRATQTGPLYLAVRGYGSVYTGRFELNVDSAEEQIQIDDHANVPASATLLLTGDAANAEIEVGRDEDWFRIEAVAGAAYTFETTLGSLRDTTLALYDADGRSRLVFNDDGGAGYASRIEWTAPSTGEYFLQVKAYSSIQTGSYTLNVTANNTVPVGNVDEYFIDEDMVLDVAASQGVLANDTDAEGDVLTATIATQPEHGIVTFNPDGSFAYTPEANYHGTDSFTYTVSDSVLSSSPIVVEITVNSVNDAPIINAISQLQANQGIGQLVIPLNVSDVDGDAMNLSARVVDESDLPLEVTVTLGQVTVQIAPEYIGTFAIEISVDDGQETVTTSVTTEIDFVVTDDGVLTISGTELDDAVTVIEDADGIRLDIAFGASLTTSKEYSRNFGRNAVSEIVFHGGGGNDRFLNHTAIPSELRGDDGDDLLVGGSANDRIFGGLGDDILMGNEGINELVDTHGANLFQSFNVPSTSSEFQLAAFGGKVSRWWKDDVVNGTPGSIVTDIRADVAGRLADLAKVAPLSALTAAPLATYAFWSALHTIHSNADQHIFDSAFTEAWNQYVVDPVADYLVSNNPHWYVDRSARPEDVPLITEPNATIALPVYYVNGAGTNASKADAEARALSAQLDRPVRLLHNPSAGKLDETTGISAEDGLQSLLDLEWDVPMPQHNNTTKRLAGLLEYHARLGEDVSIVAHSQGTVILRNAIRTIIQFGHGDWARTHLRVVLAGTPMSEAQFPNHYAAATPANQNGPVRLAHEGDFFVEWLGERNTQGSESDKRSIDGEPHLFTRIEDGTFDRDGADNPTFGYVTEITNDMLWIPNPLFGSRETSFADVTGDGKADAILVNDNGVTVQRSDGSSFVGNETWTANPLFGSRETSFADVTGDGMADAIVVNDNGVTVRRSNGSSFLENETWTDNPYYGSRETFFADVTGDGKADAIVVNDDGVTVRRSTGAEFGANEQWTADQYYGAHGTFFADVTGDGRADAIVVNDDGVTIRRSDGSGFGASEPWTTNSYYGTRGTFFADVTGDGKADAIVVNDDGVTMRRSDGSGFGANEPWTTNPYFGSRGTSFADMTGDGRADAIVVNDDGITVRRAEEVDENAAVAAAFATAKSEMEHVLGSINYQANNGDFDNRLNTYASDVRNGISTEELRTRIMTDHPDRAISHMMSQELGGIASHVTLPRTSNSIASLRRRWYGEMLGKTVSHAAVVADMKSARNAVAPLYATSAGAWTSNAFHGSSGTHFADVTGDGKADAIVVNDNGVTVRRSNGSSFAGNETWTTNSFYGSKGTYFADVTGDGKADAIVVNDDGVTVRRSNGSYFSGNETWLGNAFYGSRGTYFADVTGDGKADVIVVNDNGVTIRRSNGSSFGGSETWTTNSFYGSRETYFADVTGDGKADAIVVNDNGVTVRRSNGSSFAGNETWTNNSFYGSRETYFADVTGDGKADAIVVNDNGVTIRRSTGSFFSRNETWTVNSYYGSLGTYFADVTGDGEADAVVVNDDGVAVRVSTGDFF